MVGNLDGKGIPLPFPFSLIVFLSMLEMWEKKEEKRKFMRYWKNWLSGYEVFLVVIGCSLLSN